MSIELWRTVVENLPRRPVDDTSTIYRLIFASKPLYSESTPYLYKHIPFAKGSNNAGSARAQMSFYKTVCDNPHLAQLKYLSAVFILISQIGSGHLRSF